MDCSDWWLTDASCEIALIWMSLDFIDDQSTLAGVMAWCHLSSYGVTRPEWFKVWIPEINNGKCMRQSLHTSYQRDYKKVKLFLTCKKRGETYFKISQHAFIHIWFADGLQDCGIPSASTIEILQCCTEPFVWRFVCRKNVYNMGN